MEEEDDDEDAGERAGSAAARPFAAADGLPRFRDFTLPGVIHLSGLFPLYPGHSVPAARHLLQAGRAESQTRRRRRHSQHCRRSPVGVAVGVAVVVAGAIVSVINVRLHATDSGQRIFRASATTRRTLSPAPAVYRLEPGPEDQRKFTGLKIHKRAAGQLLASVLSSSSKDWTTPSWRCRRGEPNGTVDGPF